VSGDLVARFRVMKLFIDSNYIDINILCINTKDTTMKIASVIARFLLGLIFLVFGLNGFIHFIPMPPPTGVAGDDNSIENVGLSVGFKSADAFRRAFERRLEINPSDYRRRFSTAEKVPLPGHRRRELNGLSQAA
jgi:AraC-like DNA-binding protein